MARKYTGTCMNIERDGRSFDCETLGRVAQEYREARQELTYAESGAHMNYRGATERLAAAQKRFDDVKALRDWYRARGFMR